MIVVFNQNIFHLHYTYNDHVIGDISLNQFVYGFLNVSKDDELKKRRYRKGIARIHRHQIVSRSVSRL